MQNFSFGIKCNGEMFHVAELSKEDDLALFDYIWQVNNTYWRGNDRNFDVSIMNKGGQGMKVDNWLIVKAEISSDPWNVCGRFIMKDEGGNETNIIFAGGVNHNKFNDNILSVIHLIIKKAKEIVRDCPSANVCNAILEMDAAKRSVNINTLKSCLKDKAHNDEEYVRRIDYALEKISDYLNSFKKAEAFLKEQEDPKSKQLLETIASDCKNLLVSINA